MLSTQMRASSPTMRHLVRMVCAAFVSRLSSTDQKTVLMSLFKLGVGVSSGRFVFLGRGDSVGSSSCDNSSARYLQDICVLSRQLLLIASEEAQLFYLNLLRRCCLDCPHSGDYPCIDYFIQNLPINALVKSARDGVKQACVKLIQAASRTGQFELYATAATCSISKKAHSEGFKYFGLVVPPANKTNKTSQMVNLCRTCVGTSLACRVVRTDNQVVNRTTRDAMFQLADNILSRYAPLPFIAVFVW
jgi:hypothetical protein